MTFDPILDNIVLEPLAPEEMQGSIILPKAAQKQENMGTIIALGTGNQNPETGAYDLPFVVNVGDLVLYVPYVGAEITVEDKTFLIVKQENIYGKVTLLPKETA